MSGKNWAADRETGLGWAPAAHRQMAPGGSVAIFRWPEGKLLTRHTYPASAANCLNADLPDGANCCFRIM